MAPRSGLPSQTGKMAEMADNPEEIMYSFDISDDALLEGAEILMRDITPKEKEQLDEAVKAVQSIQNDSMEDFQPVQKPLRHKPVDQAELDRLAGKNSAETTAYQTKWAATAMKGTNYVLFLRKYTKHDLKLKTAPFPVQKLRF